MPIPTPEIPKKDERVNFVVMSDYFDRVVAFSSTRNQIKKHKNQNYFSPKAHLIRRIYWFTKSHLEDYTPSDFREQARRANIPFDFRSAKNPFNLIISIFGEHEGITFNSSQRSKYARALSYAYEHDLHYNWIQGFILQAGGIHQAADKFVTNRHEVWLKDRISEARSLRNIDFTNPKNPSGFRRI